MLPRTRRWILAHMTSPYRQRSGSIEATTWEGTTMPLTFRLTVQAHEGTRMRTDRAGQTVPCSQAHPVQQQVSRSTLGALGGLPTRHRAPGFGFQTRTSSYAIRHAVLNGSPADLLPPRPGPHTPAQRTTEVEALLSRTRFETARTRDAIAAALPHRGCTVSARRVGPVLADSGLATQNS